MFHYFSFSLKWISTGASFMVATSCFKYMGYKYNTFFHFFHFMIDVLNLKLCFITDVLTERSGSLSEPGSIFPFWSKPLNGVPLFYWLEKAYSAYPRITGLTFLFNIMWKGQLHNNPRLALVWLSINICFDFFIALVWFFHSRTPPTGPFDHLLTNCSVSHGPMC